MFSDGTRAVWFVSVCLSVLRLTTRANHVHIYSTHSNSIACLINDRKTQRSLPHYVRSEEVHQHATPHVLPNPKIVARLYICINTNRERAKAREMHANTFTLNKNRVAPRNYRACICARKAQIVFPRGKCLKIQSSHSWHRGKI